MKVLLVDPPGKNKGFNTGLAYISSILKDRHEVEVLDLNNIHVGFCGETNPDMPKDELEKRVSHAVEAFEPRLFGVSVKTFTANISRHIFKMIRDQRPEIMTVAGGPHITLDGFNFIHETGIDFGIQGEGEYTFFQLCNALEKNEGVRDIEGIYCWDNGQLVHTPRISPIKDLDALPFPLYENFSSLQTGKGDLKEYPLLTSRGCPYGCTYCSMPKIMGSKWRAHTPQRVIAELQHAINKYNSTSFTVVDDNFTLNLKRVDDICDQIIAKNINLPWNSQNGIRADRINSYMAKKMKQSGCHYVWVGIESAGESVFRAINKGEKLSDIKTGISHLKNAGIGVGGFFIIGLPYSTKASDLKSVEFAKALGIDGWWFNFVPYPHTKAWDWVQTYGKRLQSSDGVLQFGANSIDPVFETEEYPREDRISAYREIHIKLNYFDRLVDPALKRRKTMRSLFKVVAPYGYKKIFMLIVFLLGQKTKSIMNKFWR